MNEPLRDRASQFIHLLWERLKTEPFWRKGHFWWGLFGLVFTVTLIVWSPATHMPEWRPGDVASQTIRAPYDLNVYDAITTERRRESARTKVPPVYTWDKRAHEPLLQKIETLFREGRNQMAGREETPAKRNRTTAEAKAGPGLSPPQGFPPEVYRWLGRHRFDPLLEQKILRVIGDLYRNYITPDLRNLPFNADRRLTLIDLSNATERVVTRDELKILSLQEARRALRERIDLIIDDPSIARRFATWLGDHLVPNLWLQKDETEKRQQAAVESVQPVQIRVLKGQIIARAGQTVSEDTYQILRSYRSRQTRYNSLRWTAGIVLLVALILWALYYTMARLSVNNVLLLKKPLFGVSIALWVPSLLLVKILDRYLIPSLTLTGLPVAWESAMQYAYPFALGTMVWSLLGDRVRAGWFSFLITPIFALQLNLGIWQFLYIIGFNLLAIIFSRPYRYRFGLLSTGFWLGMANGLWALLLHLVQLQPPPLETMGRNLFAAFLAGPLCSILASLALPLIENGFDILTEIKLLELSNLNVSLLRELGLRAPGTYFHSIGVGQLAEAAAEAIGANALFVRVAALYHDIGKMSRPLYFVENQRGENPHDRISPNVSRLLIFSHIKEGVAMAKKYGLPQTIIDMIPQHHGTKLLTYFYGKAKAHSNLQENGEEPDESSYRYPGPKPQTKEAAILMLADGIEAAARSLREPSPKKLQNVVDSIIRYCLEDGQLDESNLTLAELRKIRDAMFRTLVTMFHQRVSYPGFDFGEGEERFEETVALDATHAGRKPTPAKEPTS